jgi:hypothetical protein
MVSRKLYSTSENAFTYKGFIALRDWTRTKLIKLYHTCNMRAGRISCIDQVYAITTPWQKEKHWNYQLTTFFYAHPLDFDHLLPFLSD